MSASNSSRGKNAITATSNSVATHEPDKCRLENPGRSVTLHFASDVLQIGLNSLQAESVEQP
jgi:hypothetical protein